MKRALSIGEKVFSRPAYLFIAICSACTLLLTAIWLPNLHFLLNILFSGLSLQEKLSVLPASFSVLGTNFTFISRLLTVAVSILFGINAALLVFYMKSRFRMERSVGTGVGGIVFGLLGAGCLPCGSVILSSFLGVGATAAFVNILPLKGQEFGFIGVALMIVSILLTAKKIEQPLSCEIVSPADLSADRRM